MNKLSISSSHLFQDVFNKIFFLALVPLMYSSTFGQEFQLSSNQSPIKKYFDIADQSIDLNRNLTMNSIIPDSLLPPSTTKPKLLPDNLSLMERILWGENSMLRKIGVAPELTPEVRKSELGLRRTMLSAHQIGGFVTLGLMLATCYYGQKVIDNNGFDIKLDNTKKSLASLTIASYSLTALLSILSPPPLIRRDDENSTTTLHKTLAWIHVAGMIATPILASYIGRQFNTDAAHVHQIAGYLTTAVFAFSMIVVTF
jgi:hypothetical protein